MKVQSVDVWCSWAGSLKSPEGSNMSADTKIAELLTELHHLIKRTQVTPSETCTHSNNRVSLSGHVINRLSGAPEQVKI